MKVADALVEALVAIDVRYVFGVSGANIEHLHDAIHRVGRGRVTSVMSRSESGAAFMADGRARVHRALGVCCATSGGGMLNLAVGVAESYAQSVPVLALVGQAPASLEGRGGFQDSCGTGRTVHASKLFAAISKYVGKVAAPQQFWRLFREAVVAARSERPGPAVLLFPRTIWSAEVDPPPEDLAAQIEALIRPRTIAELRLPASVEDHATLRRDGRGARVRALTHTDASGHEIARRVLAEIRHARAPAMLLGQGVRRSTRGSAVVEFARATRIPVATTMSARGEFPNDDPCYLGVVGVSGNPSAHEHLRLRTDLLLVVGSSFNAMTRFPFIAEHCDFPVSRLVAIDLNVESLMRIAYPEELGGSDEDDDKDPVWWAKRPSLLLVEADVGVAFEALLALYREDPFVVATVPSEYVRTVLAPVMGASLGADEPPAMRPSESLDAMRGLLPERGHVVYDAGNCSVAALHWLDVPRGSSATIALGMGGMGYAIGAAIGAQLGSPTGCRTVCFTGDGSFLIAGFEIHAAVDLRLPVLFVVFNNGMHGMCVTRQQRFFDGRVECARYAPVDVAAVARGLGSADRLWVGRARTAREVREQLLAYAEHADRPGVLELCVGHEELPPFLPLLPDSPRTIPAATPLGA